MNIKLFINILLIYFLIYFYFIININILINILKYTCSYIFIEHNILPITIFFMFKKVTLNDNIIY